MNTIVKISPLARKIDQPITVGKDLIELLTGAMYVSPMSLFREYVQNAADSIDQATDSGVYNHHQTQPVVTIAINVAARSVRIRDTGVGVPKAQFSQILTAIGGSKKRGTTARGFRGVGRLCGLGYCQELVFRTRATNEKSVSEMVWDGKRLRELLRNDSFKGDLEETIRECTTTSTIQDNSFPPHFFEVELRRITRHKNDVLLNAVEIRRYLEQVAPVPFHRDFSFGSEITEELKQYGIKTDLNIVMEGAEEPITRPFRDNFEINDRITDRFRGIEFLKVPGIDSDCDAVGWVLRHSCLGAIPRRLGISGLRARVGNIQVGDTALLEQHFPEQRFNSWCVGEIHVLTSKVVPNGRRDDFEANAHYANLQAHVSHFGKEFAKRCRDLSSERNKVRQARDTLFRAKLLEETFLSKHTPQIVKRTAAQRIRQYSTALEKVCHPTFVEKHEAFDLLEEMSALQSRIAVMDDEITSQSAGNAFIQGDPERIVEEVFSALFNLTADPRTVAKVFQHISKSLPSA